VGTAYAACAADNQLNGVGGHLVYNVNLDNGYSSATANDLTDCCVKCLFSSVCAGYTAFPGTCLLINGVPGVCIPSFRAWSFETRAGYVNPVTIGNGNCGQGTYNGDA